MNYRGVTTAKNWDGAQNVDVEGIGATGGASVAVGHRSINHSKLNKETADK